MQCVNLVRQLRIEHLNVSRCLFDELFGSELRLFVPKILYIVLEKLLHPLLLLREDLLRDLLPRRR